MLSTSLRAGSAFALWLAFAPTTSAQTPPPVRPTVNAAGAAAPDTADAQGFRAKSLIGATINLQGGSAAGTIDDLVFTNEGVIEYLIVNNGGKLITVPWEAAKFNWGGANVNVNVGTAPATGVAPAPAAIATLSITPQQYQAIPTYTSQAYPNFYTPTYRTDIYRVYGLTPGQGRRIERRIERRTP